MVKADKSKRSFFKKVATAAGFVSASGYLSKLISSHSNSIQAINENSERDVIKQKQAWLQKKWVPMSDNEKNRMLDELLDMYNKSET